MLEAGVPGTGTASDALVVCCPDGPVNGPPAVHGAEAGPVATRCPPRTRSAGCGSSSAVSRTI
ncbi:hypothetical protein [Frankia sp. CcWB3]